MTSQQPKKIISIVDLFNDVSFLEKLEEFNSYTNKSILNRQDILEAYEQGNIIIANEQSHKALNLSQLQNCSYDITLGKYYFRHSGYKQPITPHNTETYVQYWGKAHIAHTVSQQDLSIASKYNLKVGDSYIILKPHELILAHTNEFIGGVNTVNTELRTRSTMRRSGLDICGSAGWGDIGYINRWTLEIKNDTNCYVVLPVNTRVGQIIFLTTRMLDTEHNYDGKYQNNTSLQDIIKSWSYTQLLPRLEKVDYKIPCIPDEFTLKYIESNHNYNDNTELYNMIVKSTEVIKKLTDHINVISIKQEELQTKLQSEDSHIKQNDIQEIEKKLNTKLEKVVDYINKIEEKSTNNQDTILQILTTLKDMRQSISSVINIAGQQSLHNSHNSDRKEIIVVKKRKLEKIDTQNTQNAVEHINNDKKAVENIVEHKDDKKDNDKKDNTTDSIIKEFVDKNDLGYNNTTLEKKINTVPEKEFVNKESITELVEEEDNVEFEGDSDEENFELFKKEEILEESEVTSVEKKDNVKDDKKIVDIVVNNDIKNDTKQIIIETSIQNTKHSDESEVEPIETKNSIDNKIQELAKTIVVENIVKPDIKSGNVIVNTSAKKKKNKKKNKKN